MRINGYKFPNLDYGYETAIRMPFHFSKLGNGKISAYDEGPNCDIFVCKGSIVISGVEGNMSAGPLAAWSRFNVLVDVRVHGYNQLTECLTTGFYPFTPAILASGTNVTADLYYVRLNKVERKGSVDIYGRAFQASFELLFVRDDSDGNSDILIAPYQVNKTEGGLVVASKDGTRVSGLRFPPNGFSPSKEYNVFSQSMFGGNVETVAYGWEQVVVDEPKSSALTITATQFAASNLIKLLLTNIRSNIFTIITASNYHLFGNGSGSFDVRLSSAEIRVRHARFDEFEISFNVVEA
jgi:hypothetical protein